MKIGKGVAKERKRRAQKTSFSQPLVLQLQLALTSFKPVHVPIITYLLITLFSDLRQVTSALQIRKEERRVGEIEFIENEKCLASDVRLSYSFSSHTSLCRLPNTVPPQDIKHLRAGPKRERAQTRSGLRSRHQRTQRSLQLPGVRPEVATQGCSLGRTWCPNTRSQDRCPGKTGRQMRNKLSRGYCIHRKLVLGEGMKSFAGS